MKLTSRLMKTFGILLCTAWSIWGLDKYILGIGLSLLLGSWYVLEWHYSEK